METNPPSPRTRKVIGVVVGRRRRRHDHDHDLPRYYYGRRQITAVAPLTHLMKYAVPAVLSLLALRYQRNPDALFGGNPAALWCFVAATAVYWLIVGAMKQQHQQIMTTLALVSGIVAALSLLSMFLTYPLSLLPLLSGLLIPLLCLVRPLITYISHHHNI